MNFLQFFLIIYGLGIGTGLTITGAILIYRG
jgi:hypothetical protein